jgi:diguanylate cyclase (GGDEF)-like protein
VKHPRGNFWLIAAMGILVVGSTGSFFAGNALARNDAQKSRLSFVASSQEIASTLKLALEHEQDLDVNAGAFFVTGANSSQTQFRQWMAASSTFSRYPELTGIAEVVVVPASKLGAFEARSLANPAGTLGAGGTFQITPPGTRPYYCFADVSQSKSGQSVLPAGFDYCDTILGPAFLKSRDSGEGAYLPFGAGKSEQLVLGTPMYSTGNVPPTVSARRGAFIGWIGTEIVPSVLLTTALQGHQGTAVAFEYRGSSAHVTFKEGSAPSGAASTTVQLHNGWFVQTYVSLDGDGVFSNGNALILFLAGLLLSMLLGVLIYVLGTSRSRALIMVHERTDQLQHQALHDPLTGLPNRALILDRIDRTMARAQRDSIALAVLFLDLDNFKDINDTLGHDAGDQLLVGVGMRLSNMLRSADTVGRLGGDEFVILAEGDSLAPGAETVAERILDALKAPFEIRASDVPLTVTASIGVAEGTRARPEDLLRDADIAMYRAKSAGKQCAVMFLPAMQQLVDDQRTLAVDLSASLQGEQYFLLYQPTINLATGAFTGVEALLRWRHPVKGVIMPNDFIPALESSGMIVPVGSWVLHEACRQGALWHDQGYHFTVSVNISGKQLEHDRIIDDVRAALSASNFDPAKLILELTETTLMHDVDVTISRLETLKTLGVHLAIDDFGTGYSSMAYLRQFPIDILKIDRSFVSGIVDTKEAAALVHTLVQLGKTLGLETIAEGIESDEQRRQLVEERVDVGQGFLFARPLDVEAVNRLLADLKVQADAS